MISIQNLRRKSVLPITILLMGALFLITNKKSSNSLQNADFIRHQESNSEISSSFISKNLPELKQEIYERARSSKDVKAEFTKRGKISNLSNLVKHLVIKI